MPIATLLSGAVVALLVFVLSRLGNDAETVRRLQRSEYRALIQSLWWR